MRLIEPNDYWMDIGWKVNVLHVNRVTKLTKGAIYGLRRPSQDIS